MTNKSDIIVVKVLIDGVPTKIKSDYATRYVVGSRKHLAALAHFEPIPADIAAMSDNELVEALAEATEPKAKRKGKAMPDAAVAAYVAEGLGEAAF